MYRGYIRGIILLFWGCIGIMEKKMATAIVHWDNNGIMKKKMATTIVHWGNIGIMENNMEGTIMGAYYTGLRALNPKP